MCIINSNEIGGYMRKKSKQVWSIEWMRGDKGNVNLGTFSTKAKALEAIDFWAKDGEFTPIDLGDKKPFSKKPSIVNINRWGKHPAMFLVHPVNVNNGAAIARIKYEK
jgi:hypothetical protein